MSVAGSCSSRWLGWCLSRYVAGDLEQQVARLHQACSTTILQRDAIGGHDDGRHQALRTTRHYVQIETDEFIAGPNFGPRLDSCFKSATAELNGVDADVDQHIDALRAANGHRMAGLRQSHDFPVARSNDSPARRINGKAVAEHASGKHGIGHLIERRAPALERREDL